MLIDRPRLSRSVLTTQVHSEGDKTASTQFALDVSNTLTNCAHSKTLAIPEDSLKLVLKEELEKYDARLRAEKLFSLALSFLLAGFSTLGVKVSFWKQEFTVSTIFFLATLCFIGWALRVTFSCRKEFFSYNFVEAVFQRIRQRSSNKKQVASSESPSGSLAILHARPRSQR